MKKIIIFFLLIFSSIIGKNQVYTPFNYTNGQWICGYFSKGGILSPWGNDYVSEFVKFYCQGDTLINDTLYNKLFYIGYANPASYPSVNISGYYGAIRNDTIGKKVWFNKNYFNRLLYDFNLNLLDSIHISCSGVPVQIYSIDSIEYCNVYHKRYNYIDNILGQSFLIEGIGSSDGLIPVNCLTSFGNLSCYSEDNILICDTCQTPAYIIENNTYNLNIFPNPTNEIINVSSDEIIISVELTDIYGRIIYHCSSKNTKNIEIKIPHSGSYILKVITVNKTIMTRIIRN